MCAVSSAALLATWPAIYNGFPILFPDSVFYLQDGRRIARAIFLGELSSYYGPRSPIYALGIYPFHWNSTAWPIVGLNATVTAYVIWLVTRSLLPRRPLLAYAALVVPLAMLTSWSWYVSIVMPDVLGPVLYLSIFLLAFCWESLGRAERVLVGIIAWWAMASHATHLLLAGGLCILVPGLLIAQGRPRTEWLGAASRVAALVVLVVLGQLAIHYTLYGEPAIDGKRQPHLLARVVADGPGRWYLEENCDRLDLAICGHLDQLPDDAHDFLFAPDGVYQSASPAETERIRREELQVVLGTLRAHPWAQLRISAGHAWSQLFRFGIWGYNPRQMVLYMLEIVLPDARLGYLESRQARGALQEEIFNRVQYLTVLASVGVIVAFVLLGRRIWSRQLVGFAALVVAVTLANAVVTGMLSIVDHRFQARVVWLLPLLAGVLGLRGLERVGERTRVKRAAPEAAE